MIGKKRRMFAWSMRNDFTVTLYLMYGRDRGDCSICELTCDVRAWNAEVRTIDPHGGIIIPVDANSIPKDGGAPALFRFLKELYDKKK